MNDDKEEGSLLGICLTCEGYIQDAAKDVPICLVSCPPKATVAECRSIIEHEQLPLPAQFSFVTAMGWPVLKQQEGTICVDHIKSDQCTLRIQKKFSQARIGVTSSEGEKLGFVFTEHNCAVKSVRDAITRQLQNLSACGTYQFIDRNGWPVSPEQEGALNVFDLLQNNCVVIKPYLSDRALQCLDNSDGVPPRRVSVQSPYIDNQGSSLKQLTYQDEKDLYRIISMEEKHTYSQKDILISYVRAEAAHYAVMLKEKLTAIGYSVFLDVHEIKYGVDWQDALNHAVSNCEAFVPLVTPRYGETQWTNREVKLADVLSKFILPINFLDHWPPKCLAIQFATTQYIPFKSLESVKADIESGKYTVNTCYRRWEDDDVRDVVSDLNKRLKAYDTQDKKSFSRAKMKKASTLRSCPVPLPKEFAELSQHRDGRPLIVISQHPKQKAFGEDMRELLEAAGFEVWCSSDLHPDNADDNQSDPGLFSQESYQSAGGMSHGHPVLLSQLSQLSQGEDDPVKTDICKKFQEKADDACLVIFVLSIDFAQSRTSQMQVYYCEHRKRVIPIMFQEFPMPGWMSMLIGTGILEDANSASFKESLVSRVRHAFKNPNEESADSVNEFKLSQEVRILKEKLPKGTTVYIAGGTKFYNKRSEEICRNIGRSLARLNSINVITGGFYGVGETIGKFYDKERSAENESSNIFHILPHKDDLDRSKQAQQNEDGSFLPITYGNTVFSGDSVRERENIVSRAFDICILVEGGPGAAHEAEQFAWNDHIVIPVKCTGGAAGGKFNVPEKIFELPPAITESDWLALSETDVAAEDIGQCVANIVKSAKARLKVDSPTYYGQNVPNFKDQTLEDKVKKDTRLSDNFPVSPRRRKHPVSKAPSVSFKKDRK